MALGPDFKENYVETGHYDQADISATIAQMFGLQMPYSQGKPIDSILK
jgi:phosphopentomutase